MAAIKEALSHACKRLGNIDLKDAQHEALSHFLNGKDVFVSLPTGYGKSVIYQAAPFCVDKMKSVDSMAIVISPLVSLMEDQHKSMQNKGIKAIYLANGVEFGDLSSTKVVLASPEMMMGERGRNLLMANRHRICGLFVDESHCVAMW